MTELFSMELSEDLLHDALSDFRNNPFAKIIDLENDFSVFIERVGEEESQQNDFQIELRRARATIVWTFFYKNEDPYHPGRSINSEPPYYLSDVMVGEWSRDEDDEDEDEDEQVVEVLNTDAIIPRSVQGADSINYNKDDEVEMEALFPLKSITNFEMFQSVIKHTSRVFQTVADIFGIPVLDYISHKSILELESDVDREIEDDKRKLLKKFGYIINSIDFERETAHNLFSRRDYLPSVKIVM